MQKTNEDATESKCIAVQVIDYTFKLLYKKISKYLCYSLDTTMINLSVVLLVHALDSVAVILTEIPKFCVGIHLLFLCLYVDTKFTNI